jgi:hypothetical protein
MPIELFHPDQRLHLVETLAEELNLGRGNRFNVDGPVGGGFELKFRQSCHRRLQKPFISIP